MLSSPAGLPSNNHHLLRSTAAQSPPGPRSGTPAVCTGRQHKRHSHASSQHPDPPFQTEAVWYSNTEWNRMEIKSKRAYHVQSGNLPRARMSPIQHCTSGGSFFQSPRSAQEGRRSGSPTMHRALSANLSLCLLLPVIKHSQPTLCPSRRQHSHTSLREGAVLEQQGGASEQHWLTFVSSNNESNTCRKKRR